MENNLLSLKQCEELKINQIWDLYKNYVNKGQVELISSFGFGRDTIQKAEGCYIYTKEGKRILDFTGGMGVLNHGHNHPKILSARIEYQKHRRMEVHKNFFSPYVAGLSHNIAKLLPDNLNISYFCNSGSEAVESAVKIAFKYHQGKRNYILHSDISFHGKLLGAASLTASADLHFRFPQIPNTVPFKYNDIESVKGLVGSFCDNKKKSDIYAIILEPFSTSCLLECSSGFLSELLTICNEEDIILIFDEVFSGWCKCGELFTFMKHDVTPDILCYSKSFGGGKSSISGYTARDNVFNKAYGNVNDALLHGTTYNAFGEECITAIEAINIMIEDDYVSKAKRIFNRLNPGLLKLQQKYPDIIREVRGSGALNGILLEPNMNLLKSALNLMPSPMFKNANFLTKLVNGAVNEHLYSKHNILTYQGTNYEIPIMISPPLVVTDDEIDFFLDSLDKTFEIGLRKLVLKFIKSKFLKR